MGGGGIEAVDPLSIIPTTTPQYGLTAIGTVMWGVEAISEGGGGGGVDYTPRPTPPSNLAFVIVLEGDAKIARK